MSTTPKLHKKGGWNIIGKARKTMFMCFTIFIFLMVDELTLKFNATSFTVFLFINSSNLICPTV